MFKYLPTIGMAGGKNRRLHFDKLMRSAFTRPDERVLSKDGTRAYCRKYCGEGFGVYACGAYKESASPQDVDGWGVFADSANNTDIASSVTRVIGGGAARHALCESKATSAGFEFRLSNVSEERPKAPSAVNIAMLSLFGKVLLPVYKDDESRRFQDEAERMKQDLTRRARRGDAPAATTLNETMSRQAQDAQERLRTEDVFSVLEGYLMTLSPDSAIYSVLGEIVSVTGTENRFSGEQILRVQINTGGLVFDALINKMDLLGNPKPGLRFCGAGMLQGGFR